MALWTASAPSMESMTARNSTRDYDPEEWFEGISEFDKPIIGSQGPNNLRATRHRSSSTSWCRHSRHIMPSQEDLLYSRKACSRKHVLRHHEFGRCNNPYGNFIRNDENNLYFYVEIPKTGSTILSCMLYKHMFISTIPSTDSDVGNVKAFAFIRHPVLRFLSGYGTIVHRVSLQKSKSCIKKPLQFLFTLGEPHRFNKFVKFFVNHGSGILKLFTCTALPCTFHHVMSQTWFLNFWPGAVDLYEVEKFADGIKQLNVDTKLNLTLPTETRINEAEGSEEIERDLLMEQHSSIQKLHEYFRVDMNRFGYTPLPGFT